ncbi:alkaline phosphatase family protein [Gordonia sp. TBRC 11910]|uniref:Alkaline phosphatase family protein n=1 Tax=Gordonia asplenii TaxID=2725283 RepID=A0A848KPP5_9ACTN|nr:nucleotide pyrophosphatase/phosphodiesterase family protein [Gordonia asplenii]NMO00300.1 alkaline phosphatase family protein [Gordonia asplenii]
MSTAANPLSALPAAALADVLPAVAAGLGFGGGGALRIPVRRDVVVLLIDGLGAELLAAHADRAPTLAAAASTTIRAGFPATTATSLTSLSVGAPCGVHGIIGYSFVPDGAPDGPASDRRLLNSLRWTLDHAEGPTAVEAYPPQRVQVNASFLQRFGAAGVEVHYVTPGYQRDSPLTQAVFRERGTHHPASTTAEIRDAVRAICAPADAVRRFTYAYYGNVDFQGHLHGPGSAEWLAELGAVDAMVAELASDLPPTCTLVVTADHGMVPAGHVIDIDTSPELLAGVDAVAGEARVRHVYAASGAASQVRDAWASTLGEHAHVVTRSQAIDEHWFGAQVSADVAARIGDVVAVARGHALLTRSVGEPLESSMAGHHGAWTTAEQLVPLIVLGA